jgi:hypothetical protein
LGSTARSMEEWLFSKDYRGKHNPYTPHVYAQVIPFVV